MYLITNMDKGCKDKRKICTFLLLNEKLVGIVLTHASKSDVVVCTRNMQSEKQWILFQNKYDELKNLYLSDKYTCSLSDEELVAFIWLETLKYIKRKTLAIHIFININFYIYK